MMKKILHFILIVVLLGNVAVVNAEYGFVMPSKYLSMDEYLQRIEFAHGIKMSMDAPGFYIFIENENLERSFENRNADFAAVFLIENSNQARVVYVPHVPSLSVGAAFDRWMDCIERINRRHLVQIAKSCSAVKTFSEDVFSRVEKFVSTGFMSIEDIYGAIEFGYLHIVSVDSLGKKKFFHMPASSYLKTMNSAFFDDYIYLYDLLKKIMIDGFGDCRWNNFDNINEIDRECRL